MDKDTKHLQVMVQMHSYLVTNAKSELKFLDDNVTSEELNETFNQIALAMNSGDDLFDDDDVLDIIILLKIIYSKKMTKL